MKMIQDIIIAPVITEASMDRVANKTYTFKVAKNATKPEIAHAVEAMFGVKVDKVGDYFVEYSYFPNKVSINDDIDYYLKLNELTFAMGVVGEYYYLKGAIDDACMWDKRFKSSMFNLLRPKRSVSIPARRW